LNFGSRVPLSVLFLCLCSTAAAQTSEQANGGVPPDEIRVILLGTASGPRVHVGVAGISTLVEAGGDRFLFDAGRGFMQRMAAGIFSKVSPRLAVFSHSPGTAGIVEQTRRSYSGRVEMGTDLMVIDIGDEVRVTAGAAARFVDFVRCDAPFRIAN
jgi:hypothetical protein